MIKKFTSAAIACVLLFAASLSASASPVVTSYVWATYSNGQPDDIGAYGAGTDSVNTYYLIYVEHELTDRYNTLIGSRVNSAFDTNSCNTDVTYTNYQSNQIYYSDTSVQFDPYPGNTIFGHDLESYSS